MFDLKSAVGSGLPTFQEEPACAQYCPKLTFQQRIVGFLSCAGVGWLLALMGALTLIGGTSAKNIQVFVVLYVLGNVTALLSTGFLLGPRSQCVKMFHQTRRITTIFYLSMLLIVFCVAITKQNVGIIILLLLIQICAAFWYSISYIPFGRKIAISIMRKSICKPCFEMADQLKGQSGGGGGGGFTMLGHGGATV